MWFSAFKESIYSHNDISGIFHAIVTQNAYTVVPNSAFITWSYLQLMLADEKLRMNK
jgi:hypothetical protein